MHETATFLLSCPHIHRLKNFTDRLSNKPFLMWLLTVPPNLKYVANVPCNLSSIACFLTSMYHKVVWQHMQRVAGSLITALLQIYPRIFQWKKRKFIQIWQNDGHEFDVQFFSGHRVSLPEWRACPRIAGRHWTLQGQRSEHLRSSDTKLCINHTHNAIVLHLYQVNRATQGLKVCE